MKGTIRTEQRELASRESGGLEVSLTWDPTNDALSVVVTDWQTGDAFDFAPDRRRALDAFYHPFAYASEPALRRAAASADHA